MTAEPGFHLAVFDTPAAAAEEAASRIAAAVRDRPDIVLGLATGNTMLGVYDHLAARHREGLSLARATAFNLDEYVGLAPGHPAGFAAYMARHLGERTDLPASRMHLPDPADPAAFEEAIGGAGGIGLQLLGIGRNGHIGFNEPGTPPDSRTRVVTLSAGTRRANAGDFPAGEAVPPRAVTMGVATILEASEIVLLATGAAKAPALAHALAGPVGPEVPASFLRRHRALTVLCDAAAAAGLTRATTPTGP